MHKPQVLFIQPPSPTLDVSRFQAPFTHWLVLLEVHYQIIHICPEREENKVTQKMVRYRL